MDNKVEESSENKKPEENEGLQTSETDFSDGPCKKKLKLIDCSVDSINLNPNFESSDFIENLKKHWKSQLTIIDNDQTVDFASKPFNHCVLQNFLSDKNITSKLVNEMTAEVQWTKRQMDLYEFYQSRDISGISLPNIQGFYKMLKEKIMPWMEEISGIKLKKVSASCSMYTCGDYLLVHDDLLKDRQIAFVYYLSPWENVETWTEEMGGCLELFPTDANSVPVFPVVKKIPPRNNQFVFFKVGSKSFHQVGEVVIFDYPRLTINGWFHGEENKENSPNIRNLFSLEYSPPQILEIEDLSTLINSIYLDDEAITDIQKQIEDNSEIFLEGFLNFDTFVSALDDLKNLNLNWSLKGPANVQHYEVCDINCIPAGPFKTVVDLFRSDKMFQLLKRYTDLDLTGSNAQNPTCNVEVQRWYNGCYTILGDSLSEHDTLDVVFYLSYAKNIGVITYVSPEMTEKGEEDDEERDEDAALLTVTPQQCGLSIVYKTIETSKFTKLVSKRIKIDNDFVYMICCSYKE